MHIHMMTKRIVILTTAAIIGAGTVTSAFAAERNKTRTRATYAQAESYGQAHNQASPDERFAPVKPASVNPDKCVTDEGYGRYTSCDAN